MPETLRNTAALCALLWAVGPAAWAQQGGYALETDWASLPDGAAWGQVVAVDVDGDGNIYALHRCGADTCLGRHEAPLLKFAPDGTLLRALASDMLVWPHGLHIDTDGNVWVTDGRGADGKGHQVLKLSPDGDVLMTLGLAGVAGEDERTLNGPTDVAVAADGHIFVADGHGNSRIVKYAPDGTFVAAWGRRGSARGEFEVPHAIAIDSLGRVLVADRDNDRVQIFDQDGNYLDAWTELGSPSGFYMAPDDVLWIAHAVGVYAAARDGAIRISIDHEQLGAEAGNIEDVAADAAGNVYAGLAGPLALHRLATP